jgi:hypothetical protein
MSESLDSLCKYGVKIVGRRIRREERNAHKNVVVQQMEHDDMADGKPQDKSAATPRKPPPLDGQSRQPEQPQIRSPLLGDGPELVRDSHC